MKDFFKSLGFKVLAAVALLPAMVLYGVNVGTVVKSIINKVKYVMEESTGISVERVNVYVDEIKT